MIHPNVKFLSAVGTLIGSVVGVGVFGLPYVFARTGFAIGAIWLIVLVVLLTALQLMYAEVCIQTDGVHRLSGYVKEYLGKRWGFVTFVALCGSLWGAMLAFLIVGGRFLHILVGPALGGEEWMYGVAIGVAASILIWRGTLFAAKVEMWIVIAMLFLFAFLSLASLSHFHAENLLGTHWSIAFLPYGVVLFSLAGMGAVPEMKLILGRRQEKKLSHAIVSGMSIIGVLYLLFALAVVGATGASTTQTAFDGLVPMLGVTFGVAGSVLGVITVLSIYMIVGVELQNSFVFDRRIPKISAFILAAFVPVLLYVFGLREFIDVIGFVGSVFVGVLGIAIVKTYEAMRKSPVCVKHHCLDVPSAVSWTLIVVFAAGILWNIVNVTL
jgi:amino acid permease